MTHTQTNGRGRRRGVARPFRRVAAAAALVLAACSAEEILDVTDIDVATPESVSDSTALPAVLAGAIGNFGNAYNGNLDINQVALAGMITDEYINTETFPTRIEVDQRRQQYQSNGSLTGTFYAIQQARAAADFAADAYRQFAPTAVGFAEALNLSALTYIMMAENYCGAVPISRTVAGQPEYGVALTTRQLLTRAVEKADSALALFAAGSNATQARVARVVKARALLNLDDYAAAAAAIGGAAGVPTTFQYNYVHSELTGRQNNGTWNLVQNSGRFGVGQVEGVNGLPFRVEGDTNGTIRDPRVANVRRPTNSGFGFDGATPMWWQLKYPIRAAAIVIVDGVEARLIEAEALLRSGDYPGALLILNALNADAALAATRGYTRAIPALTPAATPAAQVDQLFKERAYWLYLTSHRLGDMRRLTRPTTAAAGEVAGYGRAIESVFPTAAYHKPGTYGTDVNSPIPQAEDNNPQFDRAQCDVTRP